MSAENIETTELVVCVRPNHPAGQRNRAWFTFTEVPTVFKVTAEQEKSIREDQFLRIIERGTAYDDAMSNYKKKFDASSETSPEPLKNESEWSENKNPTETSSDTSNANPDENNGENPADPKDPETKDPADIPPSDEWSKDPEDQKPAAKPVSRMNKEELVAGLEVKWLKAGEGFDPNASNKDLAALLSSL